jgi:signal transduction histidine kinase
MRRRLLFVLLPLLTALLAALEGQLAQTYAVGRTQQLLIREMRQAETYAVRAETFVRNGAGRATLADELRAYADLHDVTVAVFDNDGDALLSFPRRKLSPAMLGARNVLLVGATPDDPDTIWPWRQRPMIVGETIGKRGPPAGAIVFEVPTGEVADGVMVHIAELAGTGLAVLLLTTVLGALPLARWVLRPVDDLNDAAGRLAAGDLGARASVRGGPAELRGLARAFNQMADSLVAALQRQRAFVADASHELRNPLATLRLRMEALAGKVHGDGERDRQLALSEGDRLAGTVDRLLELARAEATASERVDLDVVSLTAERLAAWTPALAAAGNVVHVDAPTEAMSRTSPDTLEYALDVVLDNARKFAPGAPIDVGVHVDDAGVELVVRDHGRGLGAAELASVGERFWRSADHRGVPGTGLGLATARALLEGAGAAIDIDVAEPGLSVRLRLPVATGPVADTSARHPGATEADTSRSRHAG